MLVRPRDLADRMSGTQQLEIFTLPIDAARCKAREIIDQVPQGGYVQVVENWRPLRWHWLHGVLSEGKASVDGRLIHDHQV